MIANRRCRKAFPGMSAWLGALLSVAAASPAQASATCDGDPAALDPAFRAAQMALTSRPSVALDRTLALPDSERGEIRDLLAERDRLRAGIEAEDQPSRALMEADTRLAAIEQDIGRRVPGLLDALAPDPLKIEQVQSGLGEGRVLLLYLEDEERSYGWAITEDCAMWQVLEDFGREDSAPLVSRIRDRLVPGGAVLRGRSIAVEPRGTGNLDADLAQAHAAALAPFAALLEGKSEVLVHAEGNFLALPFPALRASPEAGYLVDTHSVAWLPSLRSLAADPSDGAENRHAPRLLAVGAPSAFPETGTIPLAPLPGAERELASLKRNYGANARVLSGEEATEEKVSSALAGSDFDVVLFATHALTGGVADGGLTGLALGPGASPDAQGTDGLLAPVEIAGMPLDGKLAILAGCDTWAGEGGGAGEALTAISLAFLQAGARDLVVTHWPVVDGSAALWSQAMLAQLASEPGDLAGAVRAGQLALRNERAGRYDDPRHWAAYIPVVGGLAGQER